MKVKLTIELEVDETYGEGDEDKLWLENEILIGDGSLSLKQQIKID